MYNQNVIPFANQLIFHEQKIQKNSGTVNK